MTSTQPSTLLASLFEHLDEERCLTVLDIGSALPETVDFFSRYRCKLHFVDLFSELPIVAGEIEEEGDSSLQQQFSELLQFPVGTRFDICLFWDLFNFLDSEAISAFVTALRPNLRIGSLAHGFAVHSTKSPQGDHLYGVSGMDELRVRHRAARLPGYTPHTQGQLQNLLNDFSFDRSMLLPDSRLELLLRVSI
ncbi:MAG: hypothetical protein HOC23_05570 [Halieaceae bacterium]|jgi:hypothetical protein|nr:hypothetical protein [Halieaceae bacterium]